MRSVKTPTSIRTRLIVALSLVLLAIWLSAAIFTKKTAFAQSRAFLEDQARTNAALLLEVVKDQPISPLPLNLGEQHIVLLWREGELQLGRVDDDLTTRLSTYLGKDVDAVEQTDYEKWVISSRCQQEDCVVVAIRDTDRKFAIRRLIAYIFLPIFGLFLLGLGAVYLAIRYALSPLDALASSVQKMDPTIGLKLDETPKVTELLPVVDAINDMSRRTREHMDQEQAFLDACAHEVRTPLAGLIAQAQSLQESAQTDISKSTRAHLTFIERSAQRASRIANQFLGLAKTRNRVADERKNIRFDLAELVRTMAAEAMRRDDTLEISLHGEAAMWIVSDPLPIELVLRNLIENAQHHAKGSDLLRVQLVLSRQGNEIVLSVEDNGQGVPAGDLAMLGTRFFRGSSNGHNANTGTGLGLSIVNDVVTSFDGELSFGSGKELGGLLVTVRMKIQPEENSEPDSKAYSARL